MRVLALMKYGARAASARQRLLQFTPYLRDHGVEIETVALLDDAHVARLNHGGRGSLISVARSYGRRFAQLATRRDHDVLWIQYELFPWLPGVFERLAARTGKPIVVDYDDAIFHQYDAHASPAVRTILARKLEPLVSRASVCIVGNDYLRRWAAVHCDDCEVIPTVVDTTAYRPGASGARGGGPPVVGWIGSPSTWPYVEAVLPLLRGMVERGEASVLVVGAGDAASRHDWLRSIPWSEDTEIEAVQSMDVGIMPLPDDLWANGKCGYKLIQYMACGVPAVASPVGVNSTIVAHGENGLLASNDDEWASALRTLIGDAGVRATMGRHGRARVEGAYSLASQQPRLLAALERAAPAGPRTVARRRAG